MSDKNIVFIHRGGPEMASYRYRALVPATHLSRINGYSCAINGGAADILVFSKPMIDDVDMLKAAKKEGCKIVVDFCDDHFDKNAHYKFIAKEADLVVCPTPVMADRILEHTGRLADHVIPDAYEHEEKEPHAEGFNLLWYGHKSNLQDIKMWVPHIRDPWKLSIATGPNYPEADKNKWGVEAIAEELSKANSVFIPTRKGAEYKSNNRVLNAVRGGCFVIAANHPSHAEFRKWLWVGEPQTGLNWAKAFQKDLNGLVKEAQNYIREKYSAKTIGKLWEEVVACV